MNFLFSNTQSPLDSMSLETIVINKEELPDCAKYVVVLEDKKQNADLIKAGVEMYGLTAAVSKYSDNRSILQEKAPIKGSQLIIFDMMMPLNQDEPDILPDAGFKEATKMLKEQFENYLINPNIPLNKIVLGSAAPELFLKAFTEASPLDRLVWRKAIETGICLGIADKGLLFDYNNFEAILSIYSTGKLPKGIMSRRLELIDSQIRAIIYSVEPEN